MEEIQIEKDFFGLRRSMLRVESTVHFIGLLEQFSYHSNMHESFKSFHLISTRSRSPEMNTDIQKNISYGPELPS